MRGRFSSKWVGIELWKRLQYLGEGRLHYLRTRDGMEIDFIIERKGTLTPILQCPAKQARKPTRTRFMPSAFRATACQKRMTLVVHPFVAPAT
jgi:hypothetical protein